MLSKKKLFNLVELIIQALLLISTFTIQSITMVSHSYSSTTVTKTSIIGYAVVSGAMFLVFIPIIITNANTAYAIITNGQFVVNLYIIIPIFFLSSSLQFLLP